MANYMLAWQARRDDILWWRRAIEVEAAWQRWWFWMGESPPTTPAERRRGAAVAHAVEAPRSHEIHRAVAWLILRRRGMNSRLWSDVERDVLVLRPAGSRHDDGHYRELASRPAGVPPPPPLFDPLWSTTWGMFKEAQLPYEGSRIVAQRPRWNWSILSRCEARIHRYLDRALARLESSAEREEFLLAAMRSGGARQDWALRQRELPRHVLEWAVRFGDLGASHAIVFHPGLTPAQLRRLAKRGGWPIVRALVKRRSLPESMLRDLARFFDPSIRAAVAMRRDLPADTLSLLLRDSRAVVREAASQHASRYTPVSTHDIDALPIEDLASLVTERPIPDRCVERLLAQENPDLLLRVAGSRHASDEHRHRAYWRAVLRPSRAWRRTVDKALASADPDAAIEGLLRPLLDELVALPPSVDRAVVLMLPEATSEHLAILARSTFWLERATAAQHASTPKELLTQLVEDGNPVVVDAARWRLAQR
jgi:hypothetical protein